MNFFALFCRSQQFSEAYAKNVTNFSNVVNKVIHTIYVNNIDNPKIRAFNSCFFVHEAIHVFFSSVKN